MSAWQRSWVAAFAVLAAAVSTAAVTRGDARPHARQLAIASAAPTPGDDDLAGTAGNDVIDGAAGNDSIDGGAGNDFLVEGSTGDERLIDGGPGDDVVDGGVGNDGALRGGLGQDIVFGGRGDDVIDGGPGNDRIDAGDGADRSVLGGEGDDILLGGADVDGLDGGPGDDVLIGGGGDDNLDGGAGNDVCYSDATFFEFTIGCEVVVEVAAASHAARDVIDEAHPGIATGGANGLAKLRANREVARKGVSGTEAANVLTGTDAAEAFKTRGGDDTVSAAGGDDDLDCGAGNDTCGGGAGDDFLVGGPGDDILTGGDGNDILEGGQGIDRIVAGPGDDTIFPGDGDELRPEGVAAGAPADKAIDAGPGNDHIYAVGGGTDTIDCGDGADVVEHDSADVVASDCETKTVPLTFNASLTLTLSAERITGDVKIKKPNTTTFVPLERNAPIPVGSDIDTPGRSEVTIAVDVKQGTRSASASLSSGTVSILGPSKAYPEALVIKPISRTKQRCGRLAAAAAKTRGKKRKRGKRGRKGTAKLTAQVAKAAGDVATITRDVVAAAKSTSWTTTQTCEGTRVSVTEGVVKVLDLRRSKTRSVSAGGSTFVRRRGR